MPMHACDCFYKGFALCLTPSDGKCRGVARRRVKAEQEKAECVANTAHLQYHHPGLRAALVDVLISWSCARRWESCVCCVGHATLDANEQRRCVSAVGFATAPRLRRNILVYCMPVLPCAGARGMQFDTRHGSENVVQCLLIPNYCVWRRGT